MNKPMFIVSDLQPKDEDLNMVSSHLCPFARHTQTHQNIQPQGSHLPGAI